MSQTTEVGAEALVIATGKKAAIAGGSTSAGAGILHATGANEAAAAASFDVTGFCAVIGAVVAIGGLIVSAYFQYRRDQREQAESQWRMGNDTREQ